MSEKVAWSSNTVEKADAEILNRRLRQLGISPVHEVHVAAELRPGCRTNNGEFPQQAFRA